ncbi:MAG: hypothetical protein JWP88_559 [Flaviaesturariibacter sp.]|nr:hypothetical protein [Flaviaesturariibacter sp.]
MLTMDAVLPTTPSVIQHAGTMCPQAPKQKNVEVESVKKDPSSGSRYGCYPIPTFFEYRVMANSYEVL